MTFPEIWTPSASDIVQGQSAYIQYAVGLTMLANPQQLKVIYGNRSFEEPHMADIVAQAEELMVTGLRDVIRSVNPPEIRTNLGSVERRFEEALPHLGNLRQSVYRDHKDQLDDLNPDLAKVRPLPVTERVTYRYVCHTRGDKLATIRLLGGFMPSTIFGDKLQGKMLADDY